jgi:adenylate cyclase
MGEEYKVELKSHRITVLLIDDQPMIGTAVRLMLEKEADIDFHHITDPLSAIRVSNEIHPTVILQDLMMPDMDGFHLVRYLRANAVTKEVPLIVLSSKEEAVAKAKAFALGANDYMVKFPDALEVIARIRYHSKAYISRLQLNEAIRELEKANRFIRKTFGRYVSDSVVDAILESKEGLRLGGEKRVVTILMADLRGFTAFSERLDAEEVVSVINVFLEAMTDVILKWGGTVDKFMGDGIMALFGAPIQGHDDAQRAVAAALEMQIALAEVNQRGLGAGYPPLMMGIGINTGESIVGNIGSIKRMNYGVMGSPVNLASRIESCTVGGQVFVSQSTRDACHGLLEIADILEIMPKGVRDPVRIFEISGIAHPFDVHLPQKPAPRFHDLQPPLPVLCTPLVDKQAGEGPVHCLMVRLANGVVEIESVVEVERLTNLRLALYDSEHREITNELYAKVTKVLDVFKDGRMGFWATFTAMPPDAEAYLHALQDHHSQT